MTSVLIIGGGGMIGQKLASSYTESETVSLLDMAFPENSNLNAKKILGSVTETSIIFIIPIPPTINEIDATAANNSVSTRDESDLASRI